MFMLLWVPLPVCQIDSGNSSGCFEASTSSAAATIARPFVSSSTRRSMLTRAAAFLTQARACTRPGGIRSVEMWKW